MLVSDIFTYDIFIFRQCAVFLCKTAKQTLWWGPSIFAVV